MMSYKSPSRKYDNKDLMIFSGAQEVFQQTQQINFEQKLRAYQSSKRFFSNRNNRNKQMKTAKSAQNFGQMSRTYHYNMAVTNVQTSESFDQL